METFLEKNNVTGLKTLSDELEQELGYYVKLFVIMYADDTALLAESARNLHNMLNLFHEYCLKNIDKTKIMIFSKGRLPTNIHFKNGDKELEIVKKKLCLRIKFSRRGLFSNAKKELVDRGTKAMYEVLKRGRLHNLSIKCQLELFDSMVKPIILYGCETWGFGNNEIIERIHLKFCKLLLHLKTSTPDYMVYGKLGRYPISIDIKVRMIKFWCKLIMGKQSKLSHICYKLLYNNNLLRHGFSFWIKNIQDILNKSSLSYIWLYQNCISEKWLSNVVKMNLIDKFKQTWSISVDKFTQGFEL